MAASLSSCRDRFADSPTADVGEMSRDRSRRRRRRTDQVRTPASSLPPLEVPVARRRAALARQENVRIHSQAHRATRLAPLETSVTEDLIEPFRFRLPFHPLRPWNHERADTPVDLVTVNDPCGLAQVLDSRIRARADEYDVDRNIADRRAGSKPHVLQCVDG